MKGRTGYPGMQIDENMSQQRHEWIIQRIAWSIFFLVLVGIMLGILGRGPLSRATSGSQASGLQFEYQRFMRHRSPDDLRLLVVSSSDKAEILVDSRYLREIGIRKISPEPVRVLAGIDETTFVFDAVAREPMQISFDIQPEAVGILRGWVALKGGTRQAFTQFVYP